MKKIRLRRAILPAAGAGGDAQAGRKALQLCKQVAHTLSGVFSECADDMLRDLYVMDVAPAPHANRLLVTVTAAPSAGQLDVAAVLERLQAHAAQLRAETAAAIHRRKAPELTFRFVR